MSVTRVLHIVGIMNRGGQEAFIMNMYRNIDKSKLQFDFIVHSDEKGDYDDEIKELGGKIYRVTPKSKNLLRYWKEMNYIFNRNKEYKIIHIHTSSATVFLDAKIAKDNGIKNIIVHSHNTKSSNGNLIHRVLRGLLNRYTTIRLACGNDAAKWCFGEKYLSDVKVINNAIDIEKYSYNDELRYKLRKEMDLDNSFVIGHIGRFHDQKNHTFIIDVFRDILKINNKSKLVLIGTGKKQDEIKRKVESYGIGDNVLFMGGRDDVDRLVNIMDVFLFPSLYEGLPVTLIEVQANGMNCIISDVITDEVDMGCELIEKISLLKSSKYWAEKILKKNRTVKMDNHLKYIKKNGYDIKSTVKTLEKIYSNSIN